MGSETIFQLAVMTKPSDLYPVQVCVEKYGENHEKVRLKARITDVCVGGKASEMTFQLSTIDDKINNVKAKKMFYDCWVKKFQRNLKD
jgi:hypothetical protein